MNWPTLAPGLWLALLGTHLVAADDDVLDKILQDCHPDVPKWASVVRVRNPDDKPEFQWHHYKDSADSVAFWPASTIKVYAVVAALEDLNARRFPLDTTVIFSRQIPSGEWIQDCARTYPEMVSEVFRRSSNEDYTLLLRMLGIDAINTRFLIPEKGFPHTALMRDYVTYRPVVYENIEPQRIQLIANGTNSVTYEHQWSGISYAQQRGATALSSTTGNCTSTRELAECLRRLLFHNKIPESERYNISSAQARWICFGDPDRGIVGLENKFAGDYGWGESGEVVFPNARYFHKAGYISTYALDACYLTDKESDNHLILGLAAETGKAKVIRDMALAIYQAARAGTL